MNEETNTALRNYVERVQSFGDQLQRWNEMEVKRYLIEPLLTVLRWNPSDPNFVRHEFPVTMGSKTRKVDYALMSGDTPICVVETKAGEVDEVAARQALRYARNLDVPWALVTNGQRLCLYGVEFYTSEDIMSALVMDITISPETIDAALHSLDYLSKGRLDSEEVYDVFKTFNERQALSVFLQSKKDNLVKVIGKWIEEHWSKGSVDEASLVSALESVFGKNKRIEETSADIRTSTPPFTVVVASDFEYRSELGRGIFELRYDPTKRIDVSLPVPVVERQLEKLGLRLRTIGAFGDFYYNLRREAGLIRW